MPLLLLYTHTVHIAYTTCITGGSSSGAFDGLTTFGIRLWKPEVGAWREITVRGGVRMPRIEDLTTVGAACPGEDNVLTTGNCTTYIIQLISYVSE
jgi:hypothetical protein